MTQNMHTSSSQENPGSISQLQNNERQAERRFQAVFYQSEIIRQHEGRIWVESEEGQGATFCFSLPLEHKESIVTQPEIV